MIVTTKGTVKLNIMADSSTTATFFAVLGRNQDEESLRLMKEHSLDPETGSPAPTTKAYIPTVEGGTKERIGIRLIVDDNCAGRIGTTSASPSGDDRFGGKSNCTIAAHKRSRVAIKSQFWYIQAGPRSPSGLFASPSLPVLLSVVLFPSHMKRVLVIPQGNNLMYLPWVNGSFFLNPGVQNENIALKMCYLRNYLLVRMFPLSSLLWRLSFPRPLFRV
jgi:hypothetical protein